MANIKGSQTEKNLLAAFAGESQARNRYTMYAAKAKKDGFEQIAAIFEQTADHERMHAARLFNLLEGGELEITASFPAGVVGDTIDNLKESAAGEHYENSDMYPTFAKVAREEGFEGAARLFDNIAKAEVFHERRYKALIDKIAADKVFKSDSEVVWRCRKCGYEHTGSEAPGVCPTCAHPQAHFELACECM